MTRPYACPGRTREEKLDDRLVDLKIVRAMKEVGKEVSALVAARRSRGIADPVIDTSDERQDQVIGKLREEIKRQRLLHQ